VTALVEQVVAHRVVLPLARPYELSFGTLRHFDLCLVRVRVDGREGLGDCVALPGYSAESADSVWARLGALAPPLVGRPADGALAELEEGRARRPFATAPLLTALETAVVPLSVPEEVTVALVGTVAGHDAEDAAADAGRLVTEGHRTLKVKVGFDPAMDARRVGRIQARVAGEAVLRVDANQAWGPAEARAFSERVDPAGIEHFEQPFPPAAWREMAELARTCPLPLMLDESIESEADLERTLELRCAQVVKFKLAKAGGLSALEALVLRAREGGLRVVLGNGVAGQVENLAEILLAARLVPTTGEMNGFTKPAARLLANPYGTDRGRAVVPAGYVPIIDEERVAAHEVARLDVRADEGIAARSTFPAAGPR
jgi:L-alanine-DL-glutamate epimerase-like enolase superfamily enzyme